MVLNSDKYWRKTFEINHDYGYCEKFNELVELYTIANKDPAIKVNDTYVFKTLIDNGLEKLKRKKNK
jgi:hypothetical protein